MEITCSKGGDFVKACNLCPKGCLIDRETALGFCTSPADMYVAKIMLHQWEEPCICSGVGAGTIFFSGCNLHCVYCQNSKISHGKCGNKTSAEQLKDEIFSLVEQGASCIEFVTPTHYTDTIAKVLGQIKDDLPVPVVWNSSGYEKVETLKQLCGLIDIYMPDLKYFSSELSGKYSHASDYFSVAINAIKEMLAQVGEPHFDGNGRLLSGVIVRHLVLPDCRHDSIELLSSLAEEIGGAGKVVLSLMSQYTPDFYIASHPYCEHKNLARRLTSFEYSSVLAHAQKLGFEGYFQDTSSASARYTPEF